MTRLVCLGDSITDSERLFSPNNLGYGYVNRISAMLRSDGHPFEIINRGVDGFTVSRLTENSGRDCIDLKPDIVTILIGINDVGLMMNTDRTPSQQKAMLAEFGRSYRLLLKRIRPFVKNKVILMEPFIFPWPKEYANWIPFVQHISGQIADLASEFDCPYILLHDKLNQAAREEGFPALTEDGIHLTLHGHSLLADALYPLLLN